MAPTQGRIIRDGKEIIIPAEEIKQGDVIRILPGEAIPVDGIIISGETSVDQSVMTGESIPVDKSVNDEVFSGTINCFGSIDIKATKVGKNSSLQKLIQMVKDAEDKKAPMQRITDKWASVLVPVALVIAIITYIITKDRGLCKRQTINDYARDFLVDESADYVVLANELTVDEHLAVLEACAKHVDSAISKTINVKNDYPFEAFKDIYLKAYKGGYVKFIFEVMRIKKEHKNRG